MSDDPNKAPGADEPATDPVTVTGPGNSPSRGAQVILTGEAQTAARGGLADSIEGNTLAMKALQASGDVADGTTVDGSTRTGKPAADVVVATEGKPGGEMPAEPGTTRVQVEDATQDNPEAVAKAEASANEAAKPKPKPAAATTSRKS